MSVHYEGIPCGLPSPGSRMQGVQGGERLRPARPENALTTTDPTKIECKRCRRALRAMRAAAPDMLTALRLLVDGDGQHDELPRAMRLAREAIAKAAPVTLPEE